MRIAERLSTIAATATITSAAWILFGSLWLGEPARAPAPLAATGAGRAEPVPTAPQVKDDIGGLVIPVAGVAADQLSDTFGDARGGGSRQHGALDIMAPRGTPVLAAEAGTVEKLFRSDAGGNTIYVRAPDRATIDYYAHLDRYADGLREGQKVARGEVLGAVGSTGNASSKGPHLHFEIMRTTPQAKWYEPATPINPYPLLVGRYR